MCRVCEGVRTTEMRGALVLAVSISRSSHCLPSFIGSFVTVRRQYCSSPTTARSRPLGFNDGDDCHHHFHDSATKYWDNFYKHHQNKFFKDRHYLEKDWGRFFSDDNTMSPKWEGRFGVCPKKMPLILQNLKKVLKPNGHVLLRDYATGDYAQVELQNRNRMISENFYVRGDGTCSFYFSEDFLSTLFIRAGFSIVDMNIYCRQIENRSRNITMGRRWIRAIFSQL